MPVGGPHTLDQLRSGALAGLRRLDLSCGLTEFPREIFALADSLEVLNLSGNALTQLPDDLPRLHRLRVLFCSDNAFAHLPEVVGRCLRLDTVGFKANRIREVPAAAIAPWLRWLILTDNHIEALPDELGHCTRLQKLMLAGNRLERLPASMAACGSLELLRIAANRFDALPGWLGGLPRLSWLAYAGNPFCEADEAAAVAAYPTPDIEWSDLELQQRLGEGASGVIYRARWRAVDTDAVAVKLFKSAVNSDGLPRSEMATCIAAGRHPNLIPVEGRIANHPAGTPGLVMQLIAPVFRNLAGPPSLDSCSRDVYEPSLRMTPSMVLRLAGGLASAAAHLHARGILHGDLYAHNTLWNGDGDALLGDFGAASLFNPERGPHRAWLQRIETRAFGCLLEELIERCDADVANAAMISLSGIRDRCLQADVPARPLLADVARELAAIPLV